MLGSIRELRETVCGAASRFDPGCLNGETAAMAMQEWAGMSHAADAAMALAAARVAACRLPASAGARDAAELVARTTRVTVAQAKDAIARGTRFAAQEMTRSAATAGELSPVQATAIADAVAVNAAAETALLEEAGRSSVGELRLRCLEKKAETQDLATIERRIHARRSLRRWRDPEGAEHLHATGTKRDLAVIDRALKRGTDERFKEAHKRGTREPLEAYAFDALVGMAVAVMEGSSEGAKRRDPVRSLAVLRLDIEALVRGHVQPGETCEIAGLGPISVTTARQMLGESILKLVMTNGVEVRSVTHLGRGPNAAQKIALLWEQPVCSREGCGRRARLEYDHIDGAEYRITNHTRVDELEPLCDPDHDLKTYQGWALVNGTGVRPMVPPDDPRHPRGRRNPHNNQGREKRVRGP